MDKCEVPKFSICWTTVVSLFWNRVPSRKGGFENMESDREKGECCWLEMVFIGTLWRWSLSEEWLEYRFSAFWLRSKCSICSYQLNIWYESHVFSSILNWFLSGERVQELAPTLSRVVLALQYRQDRPTSPLWPRDPHHHQQNWTIFHHNKGKIWPVICCSNNTFINTIWGPGWLFVQSEMTKMTSLAQILMWIQKIYLQQWLLRWKTFSILTFYLSAVWRRPWYRGGESWV